MQIIQLTKFSELPNICFTVVLYNLKLKPLLAGIKTQQQFTFKVMVQITHLNPTKEKSLGGEKCNNSAL